MDIRDHCACLYQKEEHCHFSNATSILSIILSFSVFQHEFHFQLFLHFTVSYHSFFLSFLSTIFFRLAIFSSNFFLFCNLKEKTIMAAIYVNFFFTLNEFVLYFVNANIGKSLAVYGFLCKSLRYILLALCFAVKNQYIQHFQWTL